MEPIFFKPVYKSVIWGGNNIAKVFNRNIDGENIGESWELSAHQNGLSQIENEELNGKNLFDLFNNKNIRKDFFGTHCEELERFPILIKFIDASDNLSIQVHPDNEYAKINENDSGKTEVWYILDCKENAQIIYGLKEHVTKENLQNAIDNIEENVKYVDVHKGDFIAIPAGTVHAILNGVMVCEVQQSSDITYRVYDWNRVDKNGKPRELHKEKAKDVINPNNCKDIYNYNNIDSNISIYKSNVFNIDMIKTEGLTEEKSNQDSFYAYIVIEGNGEIKAGDFSKKLVKGTTFMIPAKLGSYTLSGNMKMMKIWV